MTETVAAPVEVTRPGVIGESIERVTEEDVQRIAREFFEPKSIALTVLGNLDGFKIGREELAC